MKFFLITLLTSFAALADVPTSAYTFETNIKMEGLSKDKEDKIYEATEIIKQVIASEEFKDEILKHKFNGKRRFADNRGLTNNQIYQKILAGAEMLSPDENNIMDLEVRLFTNKASKTIGYTYPNTHKVWLNTKYFNVVSTEKIAANLIHEWMHKLGFSHDRPVTFKRRYSVPYAVGRLVKKIGKDMDVVERPRNKPLLYFLENL